MTEFVLANHADDIYEIVLNRPEKRNAIHWPMMVALEKALEAWAQNRLIHSEDFEFGVQAALSKTTPEWKGK